MILISRLVSVFLLSLIIFATLSPFGLRPHLGDPNLERAVAYLLFGAALALGFPHHTWRTTFFVVGVAVLLEALQLIDPGRHGRFKDMAVKAVAGILGVLIITIATRVLRRLRA